MSERPTPPRTVIDWYDDAIAVLQACRHRVIQQNAPVIQDDLVEAVRLSKLLVRIHEADSR